MGVIKNTLKSGKKIFANTGWLLTDRVIHMGLSLWVTALVADHIGVTNNGFLNFGMAFINIFTVVCKLGVDSIIVNAIIRDKDKTGNIIGSTIGLRLLSSLLSIGVIAIFVAIAKPGDTVMMTITLIQSITLVFQAFDTFEFWFQSKLQSKFSAIAKSISYIIVCGWRLVLIYAFPESTISWYAFATVLDALVIGVLLFIFYIVRKGPSPKFTGYIAKDLLVESRPFIISSLLITVYTQMDKIMLGVMLDNDAVGLFSPAMTIINMWVFVPMAIIDSVRPVIMKAKKDGDEENYIRQYKRLYAAVIWMNIFVAIAFLFASKFVMGILYPKFMDGVPVLQILAFSKIFSLIGTTRGIWIVCEGYGKALKYFVGSGAIMNLILNYFMIPVWGIAGAAVATLITEIWTSIFAILIFKETRPLFKIIIDSFLLRGVFGKKEKTSGP